MSINKVFIGIIIFGTAAFITKAVCSNRDLKKVTVVAELIQSPNEICRPDHPLYYKVTNDSTRTLSSVGFYPFISRAGHSSNVFPGLFIGDDTILKPGATVEGCFPLPGVLPDMKVETIESDHIHITVY